MNNNLGFNNYGYPDINGINDMIFKGIQNNNQMTPATTTNNTNLFEPLEGFLKGNLFSNIYEQYKNYKPARLVPNNEQAELLLNVDQLSFAAHDLNLYLDIYPNNKNMIDLFNRYSQMTNEAIRQYENKYGPLNVNTKTNSNTFDWEAYSWPWEMEEM